MRIKLFGLGGLLLAAASLAAIAPASAGEFAPASMPAFQEAAARNQTVIIHVLRKDGVICRIQHAILEKLMKEPAFAEYLVLEVDFDTQPNALKMLMVDAPATLIFHRGAIDLGRATGFVDEGAIRALITKTAP